MSDQLSSDLASLKIDRSSGGGSRSLPWRWLIWIALLGGLGAAGYLFGLPLLQARVLKTEVRLTEVSTQRPGQASVEL
ncbi:MAG TPA: efflux RND transporter periplasmic adaptor subunit, partial [Polyangiaceae bacterium]|nr:efflux RND transporter periplasmic adaptor subunit [Polyangiaceae bacterium]